MNIRRLLPLLLLPLLAIPLDAQVRRVTTAGREPVSVFIDETRGHVHVLNLGIDGNFDGIFQSDSGDVSASWYVIDANTEKVLDFVVFDGLFNSFPLRAGVDLTGRRLYLPLKKRVISYDIDTRDLVDDTVSPGNFAGVSFDNVTATLVGHARPGFTLPGFAVVLDPSSGDTLAWTRTGVNPQMSAPVRNGDTKTSELYTMNEGTGGPDASISFMSYQPDLHRAAIGSSLPLNTFLMAVNGDRLYYALSGENAIRVIDTRTSSEVGGGGVSLTRTPIAIDFLGDSVIVVGTSEGTLELYRLSDKENIGTYQTGSATSIAVVGDSLIYATTLRFPDDSVVAIVDLKTKATSGAVAAPGNRSLLVDRLGRVHVFGIEGSRTVWSILSGSPLQRTFKGVLGEGISPYNVAYDTNTGWIYLAAPAGVIAYDADNQTTQTQDPRTVFTSPTNRFRPDGVSIAYTPFGPHLLVTETENAQVASKGWVSVLDTAGTRVARFQVGRMPVRALQVNGQHERALDLYTLSSAGRVADAGALLSSFSYSPSILTDTLGRSANHLLIIENEAGLVTMNGSHQIVGFEASSWDIGVRVSTGTSGFDGPRETALYPPDEDYVIVSTYAGDVRLIGENGPYKTLPLGAKAEGFGVADNKVFVALPYNAVYMPDSAVAVIDFRTLSVRRDDEVASNTGLQQNMPNPAATTTTIRFAVDGPSHVTLSLYSMRGQLVGTLVDRQMDVGSYSVDLRVDDLPAGSYVYTLRSGESVITRTMQVVR